MTKETIQFSETVAAGSSAELTTSLEHAATVEEVRVRFYRGPELALEVFPFARHGDDAGAHGSVETRALVETVGRDVIVGDGDEFRFETNESVEREETIGVEITNRSDETTPEDETGYGYDAIVQMDVEYDGGTTSLASLAGLREVFA